MALPCSQKHPVFLRVFSLGPFPPHRYEFCGHAGSTMSLPCLRSFEQPPMVPELPDSGVLEWGWKMGSVQLPGSGPRPVALMGVSGGRRGYPGPVPLCKPSEVLSLWPGLYEASAPSSFLLTPLSGFLWLSLSALCLPWCLPPPSHPFHHSC